MLSENKEQGSSSVPKAKLPNTNRFNSLYENDSYPGAFEYKFEVKQVNHVVGKGVFTTEHVKKGSLVWNHEKSMYATYTLEELQKYIDESPELAPPILKYGYMWGEKFYFPLDGSKYCNHSKTPSMKCVNSIQDLADLRGVPLEALSPYEYNFDHCYATRDLKPGDEITDDYRDYGEPPGYLELCRKHNILSIVEVGRRF